MTNTVVDSLYNDAAALLQYLIDRQEASFYSGADDSYRKVLALAAGSYFEHRVCTLLTTFFETCTSRNEAAVTFATKMAIERKYFQYFQWTGANVNSFCALFGSQLGDEMKREIKDDQTLLDASKAFLELGNLRNVIVHQNLASFQCDKTLAEVYQMYQKAALFVDYIQRKFTPHDASIPEKAH